MSSIHSFVDDGVDFERRCLPRENETPGSQNHLDWDTMSQTSYVDDGVDLLSRMPVSKMMQPATKVNKKVYFASGATQAPGPQGTPKVRTMHLPKQPTISNAHWNTQRGRLHGYYPQVEKAAKNDIRATIHSIHAVVSNVRLPGPIKPDSVFIKLQGPPCAVIWTKDKKFPIFFDGCGKPIGALPAPPQKSFQRLQRKKPSRPPLKEIPLPKYANLIKPIPRPTTNPRLVYKFVKLESKKKIPIPSSSTDGDSDKENIDPNGMIFDSNNYRYTFPRPPTGCSPALSSASVHPMNVATHTAARPSNYQHPSVRTASSTQTSSSKVKPRNGYDHDDDEYLNHVYKGIPLRADPLRMY